MKKPLGDFLCIPTPNTGELNPLFHTFAEFRLIVNRVVARQSTDWLASNAQFSSNVSSPLAHIVFLLNVNVKYHFTFHFRIRRSNIRHQTES